MKTKRPLLTLVFGFFPGFVVFSQALERAVFNSFGNAVAASGIYYEQNAGEPLTLTLNAGGYWLLQGFLQPEKESTGTGPEVPALAGCPTPVPVPFSTVLELRGMGAQVQQLQLMDAGGKLVWMKSPPTPFITDFPISLAEGTYILAVRDGSGAPICSIKLLKVNP
ncbi:MAG: hypothetical protein N2110_03930 [Flavobacteriales bacterium]|nr:hypothetical protein [Flavobacteriales bacterium]